VAHRGSSAPRACRALLLLLLLTGLACGDDIPPAVEAEDAEPLFLVLFDALHEYHQDAGADGELPDSFTQACAGGGRIDMQIETNEDSRDLLHQFDACAIDDHVFDGSLDYLRAGPCEEGGFSIDIVGQLEVDGALAGSCSFDLRERCMTLQGTSCGFPITLP
jgi:hypothetical protein